MGMTKRGSTALRTWVMPCSRMSATIDAASDASTRAPLKRPSPATCASACSTRAGS